MPRNELIWSAALTECAVLLEGVALLEGGVPALIDIRVKER
jgi:hypothetical protein